MIRYKIALTNGGISLKTTPSPKATEVLHGDHTSSFPVLSARLSVVGLGVTGDTRGQSLRVQSFHAEILAAMIYAVLLSYFAV